MLQAIEDSVDRRPRLQLDIGLDVAPTGKASVLTLRYTPLGPTFTLNGATESSAQTVARQIELDAWQHFKGLLEPPTHLGNSK
jgi:hypothetical protein